MSRPLRFTQSPSGELCVIGSAYATTPNIPVRRVPLLGGKVGILASDLLIYHTSALQDPTSTEAAKALHRERAITLQKALAAAEASAVAADSAPPE
jgi:hypothetical protein